MDPRYSAQEVLLCDLCDKDVLQTHCEPCNVNLCLNCIGKHLSDPSKRHNVVPYRQIKQDQQQSFTPIYPKCSKHAPKNCELFCERCDISVCSTCLSSGTHKGHNLLDILQKHKSMVEDLKIDLAELKHRINPTFQNIASDVKVGKAKLDKHYGQLTTDVIKQGEGWHSEIEVIVNKRKSEIEAMRMKHLMALEKQEDEIAKILSEINRSTLYLEKILSSNDVSLAFANQSRNSEFRKLPPKLNASLPSFSAPKINTENLNLLFGYISELSISTEDAEPPCLPPFKPFLDEPELINTLYTDFVNLTSVTCPKEEKIWTCERKEIMKLYNTESKLLIPIKSKSGKDVEDIAVMKSGELVYTDPGERTVNIVKKTQIKELIRLQGWRPRFLCNTSSNELLITMDNDDKQSKVVRYSGSTAKQTIQFDDSHLSLYSSSGNFKYICENKNMDICVADNGAEAVVVVNHTGKLRFRYTGCPSSSGRFYPYGITKDSRSQLLISENLRGRIHILDQDGQFLRFIETFYLVSPWGLCVDSKDDLFVALSSNGEVKKIKYM
ncbi:uncharacterized protein LOC133183146 [Saccostrea echinata]|uniref:uncharacterized protein LOC133183146 n=1 Tax=Saccostrea echinata TaxID=191078 RepID=UPI002A7EFDD9|nr:uncharacterized protein LOC133183146 [Saccostrea echinata]